MNFGNGNNMKKAGYLSGFSFINGLDEFFRSAHTYHFRNLSYGSLFYFFNGFKALEKSFCRFFAYSSHGSQFGIKGILASHIAMEGDRESVCLVSHPLQKS